jgi:ubiquinone/menaquinone biosynthesis C-methylase UbiE
MQLQTAISLLQPAIPPSEFPQTWADIGAGTGLFTQALDQILPEKSTIITLDKSPHPLWYLKLERCQLRVEDGNFERKMDLPLLDGMVMANALHYTQEPERVLRSLLEYLKPGGRLVLVEYDTDTAMPPWVPFPVSISRLGVLAKTAGWKKPEITGQMPSAYGHSQIYVAVLEGESGESA